MTDGWVRLDDSVVDGVEMAERAGRAATGFAGLGIRLGDAVGMLGAYAVPINWYLARDEVCHILADSGASVTVIRALRPSHDFLLTSVSPD